MSELSVEIVTPVQVVFEGEASAVVLPAHDGERGILPGHQDFVGVLGTGALKVIQGGNDYWFLVSSGVYTVNSGSLRVVAELGEAPGDFDLAAGREQLRALEKNLENMARGAERDVVEQQTAILRGRIEMQRRTQEMN